MPFTGSHIDSQADVSYNSVQFTEVIKSEVKIEPVYNKQGTAIKYSKYTFMITSLISNDTIVPGISTSADCDDNLEQLRKLLLVAGKQFTYIDKGLGDDLAIDTKSARYDVMYGPKPRLLNFEPIGHNKAVRVVFTVEVHMTDCDVASQPANVLAELWYKLELNITKKGYRKLVRTGHMELISRRTREDRLGSHTADYYQNILRSYLTSDNLERFNLEQAYKFSEDGRSCDFVHTFTEIESPNAYPTGVADIQINHATKSSLLKSGRWVKGFKGWANSMNGTISLKQGIPKFWAWVIFTTIAEQRIGLGVRFTVSQQEGEGTVQVVRVPIILTIDVEEDIFSDDLTFGVTWVSFGETIKEAFEGTGMFRPVTGTDWGEWHRDMRENIQTSQGYGEPINYNASNSLIVTPCNQGSSNPTESTKPEDEDQPSGLFQPDCPPSEASFLEYVLDCKIESRNGQKTHRRYREPGQLSREGTIGDLHSDQVGPDRSYNTLIQEKDYLIQDTGNDDHVILLKGYAIRVGRATRPPEATTYAGKKLKLADDKRNEINDRVISTNGECPVYLTKWSVYYQVLGSVNEANLSTDVDATGSAAQND